VLGDVGTGLRVRGQEHHSATPPGQHRRQPVGRRPRPGAAPWGHAAVPSVI